MRGESFYCEPKIMAKDARAKFDIKSGDKIKVLVVSDKDRIIRTVVATVLKVYPTYVLMDFGKYRECRSVWELMFDQRGLYKRL